MINPPIYRLTTAVSDIDQTNINRDIRDGNWLSTKRVGKGELFWQITNHVTSRTLRKWIAQGSLDRKSWQGGKDGRFAEVGSELAIWKALRSFLFVFVLAFGKSLRAC